VVNNGSCINCQLIYLFFVTVLFINLSEFWSVHHVYGIMSSDSSNYIVFCGGSLLYIYSIGGKPVQCSR
jgi:hypothetical protein